jgi:hypothetical protein
MQHTHKRDAHEILLVKPEGLRSHTHTHTYMWGDNIKIDIREIVCDYAN